MLIRPSDLPVFFQIIYISDAHAVKVVNGLPVGDSYKLRVEDAIKKLNYQVNSYAQGLKASKTYTIALLIPNTSMGSSQLVP